MIERKMSATANTPSSSTFYRSNVGPYQYKDIHTEASRKAMVRHRQKKLERGKSAQAAKTVNGTKNAKKKNRKRNILKSGAKRVPLSRKSIDSTRSRAKNTQARKKTAKSPANLTPKSQRERQRYIQVKNRRFLTSVLKSSRAPRINAGMTVIHAAQTQICQRWSTTAKAKITQRQETYQDHP